MPSDRAAGTTVAHRVRGYLDARPMVREALAHGLVNLSALARQIAQETGTSRQQAIVTALRRERGRPQASPDAAVRQALQRVRMDVRTGVGTLTYQADWNLLGRAAHAIAALRDDGDRVHLFHGWQDITIVAAEGLLEDLRRRLGRDALVESRHALAELNLRSDEADVPGFLAATTGALASRAINLVDVVSCRADHIFLIQEADLAEAVAALERLRRP